MFFSVKKRLKYTANTTTDSGNYPLLLQSLSYTILSRGKGVKCVKIGKRIERLRKELGIKQWELADVLHIGRSTLSGYETNRRSPDLSTLCLLADYFEVTTDYLFGRTDKKRN